MKRTTLYATALCILVLSSCVRSALPSGAWRGVLKTATGTELPFNFDLTDSAGRQQMVIHNAGERFKVNGITIQGDSVFIKMPLFDSEFKLKHNADTLTGNWIKHLGNRDVFTPFKAVYGQNWRFFKSPAKAAYNVTGRWQAVFDDDGDRDTTVGEFKQTGNTITGTFLTTTGDYRYLEGTVSGNKLHLSCFDGGHAFLFTATVQDSLTIVDGKFGSSTWAAVKKADARLPDAFTLTALKPGYSKIAFSYPDLDGNKVSLADERFKNKVVIIQIMGSWCPNCMDETAFLVNYYKKYKAKGVEIIGLAYERTANFEKSRRAVLQEKEHFSVPYPLLITGYTNAKNEPAKSLPMLANFLAFPTTIIIDKKGDVRKIYTGFSGPGTGVYYTEFVNRFEKLTDDLLAEK